MRRIRQPRMRAIDPGAAIPRAIFMPVRDGKADPDRRMPRRRNSGLLVRQACLVYNKRKARRKEVFA